MFAVSNLEKARIARLTEEFRPAHSHIRKGLRIKLKRSVANTLAFVAIVILGAIVIYLYFGVVYASLALFVAGLFYVLKILSDSNERWKIIEKFEKDYPAFLLSVSSAVKTGLDPLEAIFLGEEIFPKDSLIRYEARKVKDAIDEGCREDAAVRKFGDKISHPDIKLFHDAFIMARICGGSIAPALSRLARFTRQRQSFRRKTRAAVAMQRLSSYGIIGCSVAIAIIECVASPQSVSIALKDSAGQLLLISGFSIMLIGMGWMLCLTRKQI